MAKNRLNWVQVQALWNIKDGLNKYNYYDRRTLNALKRRGLVRYNAHTVALTKTGRKVATELRSLDGLAQGDEIEYN